eukprot:jgi/Tetstr1/454631/TSEL_041523.t1
MIGARATAGRVLQSLYRRDCCRWEHAASGCGWDQVTKTTEHDGECRSAVIEKLHKVARQHKDHPPIEALNELLRQCSQNREMENAHKLSEVLSFSGVVATPDTFVQLTANFSYFPKPGSDSPG